MDVLTSALDVHDDSFAANSKFMQTCINEFREVEQKVISKAQSASAKFTAQNKLLPHDRLSLLLDKGRPFIELMSLAGYQMHDDSDGTAAGGGLIAGIGYVSGIRCLIMANNSAIKGGTISPTGLDKTLRLQQIALENKLPTINLSESGGANLNYATQVFVPGARGFANQARLSAAGLPQITIVHGNATAGGAYQPALSDYVIAIRNKTKMFLAGPPLLKAATGEIATDEALGGAELHAQIAGTVEFLAEDDQDAIRQARNIAATLEQYREHYQPINKAFVEPHYSPQELIGVVPCDEKQPYDVREIIARIADESKFLDIKHQYDPHTVCGFSKIHGYQVGIIGNNGPITPHGATKAAQFIQLCEQGKTPLLFLHNTTGFLVGTDAEQNAIIKHGAKMIQAVANAKVAKISIVVGGSYGAGNYAMCGRGFDPRFIFAWPNSKTAVMGGAQAGKVLRIVSEEKQLKMGQVPDPKKLDQLEQGVKQQLEAGSTALFGTAHLWDDGLIDPRDTRSLLGHLLNICQSSEQHSPRQSSFGVARF